MRLLRKFVVAGVVGGATFAVTTLADQVPAWSWLLSVFVGGVALVVQFLVELDGRVGGLRSEIVDVAAAGRLLELSASGPLSREAMLELVGHVARCDSRLPVLARQLVAAEVDRMSSFVRDLGHGQQVVYDGDDWYWCLSLTRHARASIDATTYFSRRDGVEVVDDDLWLSELGQHYLHLQAEAVRRGVLVRRIFIVERPELAVHPIVGQLVAQQQQLGVQVRVLDASALPSAAGSFIPMVIFDGAVLYQQSPTRFPAAPGYTKTTLKLHQPDVADTADRFQQFWSIGQEPEVTGKASALT